MCPKAIYKYLFLVPKKKKNINNVIINYVFCRYILICCYKRRDKRVENLLNFVILELKRGFKCIYRIPKKVSFTLNVTEKKINFVLIKKCI